MRNIKEIVIHCSATPGSMNVDAKMIDRWHRAKGWLGIGYHFVIKRDGTLETGRSLDRVGAHVEGHNANSIGICMAGGLKEDGKTSENNYTPAQWTTLKKLVKDLLGQFPKTAVMGHRDFPGVAKDCPCFDVTTWYRKEFNAWPHTSS